MAAPTSLSPQASAGTPEKTDFHQVLRQANSSENTARLPVSERPSAAIDSQQRPQSTPQTNTTQPSSADTGTTTAKVSVADSLFSQELAGTAKEKLAGDASTLAAETNSVSAGEASTAEIASSPRDTITNTGTRTKSAHSESGKTTKANSAWTGKPDAVLEANTQVLNLYPPATPTPLTNESSLTSATQDQTTPNEFAAAFVVPTTSTSDALQGTSSLGQSGSREQKGMIDASDTTSFGSTVDSENSAHNSDTLNDAALPGLARDAISKSAAAIAGSAPVSKAKPATQTIVPKNDGRALASSSGASRASHDLEIKGAARSSIETSGTNAHWSKNSATLQGADTGTFISASHTTSSTEVDSTATHVARSSHKPTDTNAALTPSAQEKSTDNISTMDHDPAPIALAAGAHLTPLALVATPPEAGSVTQPGDPAAIAAAIQSVPNVPEHAAETSTSSTSSAQTPAQSATVTEPQHSLDTAQLRVHGNVSELKVSVQLPEIGKVEVRAISTHDSTTAHVTAFRHDVLPGLAAGRAVLEEALKSHDAILGSLESQTRGQANGQQEQRSSNAPARSHNSAIPETAPDTFTAEADYSSYLPDHTSISVRA